MTKIISYPSGAFGNFLTYLLNYTAGDSRQSVQHSVYDFVQQNLFMSNHQQVGNCNIHINVTEHSYLKFLIVNINRNDNANLIIEQLNYNTFAKIKNHTSLKFFEKSLITIANKNCGNVSSAYLREWFRLCFFSNNCYAIREYIGSTPNFDYQIDFEDFFNKEKLKQHVYNIFKLYNFKIVNTLEIDDIIDEFYQKQYYKNHADVNLIIDAIANKKNIDLNINLVEQAWIDNWLVDNYLISPKLQDEYPANTKQLIDLYNL